ncbi:MAG: GPW/gp25 family protein [Bacteroidetes bacterium]|nr:GPW/gp25 family protein [Bacteroidota bacterium]
MRAPNGDHLAFPFHVAANGRSAVVDSLEGHVRDELMQLLLTNLGERLFLPEFGGGIRRLVFESTDDTLGAMTKASITQAISQWLGTRITLEALDVSIQDTTITIDLQYQIAGTQDSRVVRFQRKGG